MIAADAIHLQLLAQFGSVLWVQGEYSANSASYM
jgi:hypothetical protein